LVSALQTILRSKLIDHEHVLEQNPSATELAASTLKYARTKEHGGGRFLGLGYATAQT